MENLVAQRIQARLDALGKNPSGVALEAGMGRSSVRDILLGRVTNPRIDTLKRLTGPLQCTLDYLTGESSNPETDGFLELDVMMETPYFAEAGVFRPVRSREESIEARKAAGFSVPVTRDHRIPNWSVFPVKLLDDSMEDAHLLQGDVLLAACHPYDMQIPLTHEAVLAVKQTIDAMQIEEISIRQVKVEDGGISLVCRSKKEIPPIMIPHHRLDNESSILPNFYRGTSSAVEILGVVTRVIRELPVSDAMYDIPHNPD